MSLREKELLACDFLTGIGGFSITEARRLAGIDNEIERLKQKIENDAWEIKINSGFREMHNKKRKDRRDKLKNPQSIWTRKRV